MGNIALSPLFQVTWRWMERPAPTRPLPVCLGPGAGEGATRQLRIHVP